MQESLLFSPVRKANADKWNFETPYTECWIPFHADSLNTVIVEPDSAALGTVLFFHGNGGNLESPKGLEEFFHAHHFRFAIYDYPGFGKSSGSIGNQSQLCESGEEFWKTITSRYPGPYIVCGYSLGSGVAAEVAKRHAAAVDKLILLAPYCDLAQLAGEKMPFYPKWLMSYRMKPVATLKGFDRPTLLVHGTADAMIPKRNAILLQKAIPGSELCLLDGCSHAGFERFEMFSHSVAEFLR